MTKLLRIALTGIPLLISSSAFADWVCTTNGGDSRTFTARGRTQMEAQTNAFNTCNGAGHTGRRSCQRNMQCFEEHGRPHPGPGPFPGPGPRPFPGPGPGPGPFPGPGPGPGFGVRCTAENLRGMRFHGFSRWQRQAEREALDNCYRAGSRYCQIRHCR